MTMNAVSRRSFLQHAAAAASVMGLAGCATSSGKIRLRDTNTPAGASGSVWIGGDLQVNRIGLGTAGFTSRDGVPRDRNAIRAVLRRAIELGVNHIDTADVYGSNLVERFIAEALYPYPSDLVIASKGGQTRNRPETGGRDGRPEHLREACEGSLKRLKLEQIPLYYLHSPDPKVPLEDSIGALAQLQKEGKIRHIGVSNVSLAELAKARSLVSIVAVQNQYNMLLRDSDEIIDICERDKIFFIPFSPLGGRTAEVLTSQDDRLAKLQALADERHVEFSQIALAWLLARSPVMLPIPGTTQVAHLESNVAAGKVRLTRQELSLE
jgi:aryl-alcohol dehydrogenase-like predicted oxidoreductase